MTLLSLQRARFNLAAHRLSQLPADEGVEVAFAGRSNAGKSSALNALTGQHALARTSRTPGRTQQMVVFVLDEAHRLVDLPGYGYAKVPEHMRAHWRKEIDAYLNCRASLHGVVLVADIRHELKAFDRQMLHFCAASGLRCQLLLTKADKLSRSRAATAVQNARTLCSREGWDAGVLAFSSSAGTGVDEARQAIVSMLAANGD